jgi:hypothetical protein
MAAMGRGKGTSVFGAAPFRHPEEPRGERSRSRLDWGRYGCFGGASSASFPVSASVIE